MSSDEYFDEFDDIDINASLLAQVDALEAAHTQSLTAATAAAGPSTSRRPPQKAPPPPSPANGPSAREVIDVDDSYDYDDLGASDLDRIYEEAFNGKSAAPVAGPSKTSLQRTTSATVQTTLFGGVVLNSTQPSSSGSSRSTMQRQGSGSNNLFTGKPNKIKKWDHTAFAKSGWKKPKSAKGKEKAGSFDDGGPEDCEEEEEEEVEFEHFPAPFISLGYVLPSVSRYLIVHRPDFSLVLCF